nr:MAG TPA: hypothetical protein [Caudoviricetes sp.]
MESIRRQHNAAFIIPSFFYHIITKRLTDTININNYFSWIEFFN